MEIEKNAETGDVLIKGLGEMHIDVICAKLKNKFKVEASLADPRIPYRETIRTMAEAEGKHKKSRPAVQVSSALFRCASNPPPRVNLNLLMQSSAA